MGRVHEVEKTLTELQRLIRRPRPGNDGCATVLQLPPDVTGGELVNLPLLQDEVAAMEDAQAALLADLHFEHLRKPEEDVRQFVAQCWADRKTNHVTAFITKNQRVPFEATCFMPVEHLSVEVETNVLGIMLLPRNDPRVPKAQPGINLQDPTGCVAAITERGTSYRAMALRARGRGSHVLRVMRVALRQHPALHHRQLRFQLGTTYAFDDNRSGRGTRADEAYELDLVDSLVAAITSQPVATVPEEPSTDIERKAKLALGWMERACLEGDPLVALLYLFFALEALLGKKSEGLKAHGLAFRQAMLSHIVNGNFPHPSETWFLYDKIRSAAVHGEVVPNVDEKTLKSFANDVVRALNQYLALARDEGISTRARLLAFLENHKDRQQLVAWLRRNGGDVWTSYLDKIEGEIATGNGPAGGAPRPE